MPGIESFIQGSQKLIEIFDHWPNFHDAEILEAHLSRGKNQSGQKPQPTLIVKIHTWQMTGEINTAGFYVNRHHTVVTLRFSDIGDFSMEGFNQQNVISELSIKPEGHTDGSSPLFAVEFWSSFGMGALFKCSQIEVLETLPCTEDGTPENIKPS